MPSCHPVGEICLYWRMCLSFRYSHSPHTHILQAKTFALTLTLYSTTYTNLQKQHNKLKQKPPPSQRSICRLYKKCWLSTENSPSIKEQSKQLDFVNGNGHVASPRTSTTTMTRATQPNLKPTIKSSKPSLTQQAKIPFSKVASSW